MGSGILVPFREVSVEKEHCRIPMVCLDSRSIKPTQNESARGVNEVHTRTYWCQNPSCRKKLYYKQEEFTSGKEQWQKIKRNISAFVARLRRAKESDWVMSTKKEYPFTPTRAWVR